MDTERLDQIRARIQGDDEGDTDDLIRDAEQLLIALDEARTELARLTPTWRNGEPPQNGAYVWREHPQGATIVEVLSAEDRAEYDGDGVCFWDSVDGPVPWGTARWCPIEVPK